MVDDIVKTSSQSANLFESLDISEVCPLCLWQPSKSDDFSGELEDQALHEGISLTLGFHRMQQVCVSGEPT